MARAGRPGLRITGGAKAPAAPGSPCAKEDVARAIEDDAVGDAVAVEVRQERRIAQADAAGGR